MISDLAIFEDYKIRREYDKKINAWLKKERSQSVTICHRLKLEAADGKKYITDVANVETLLPIIQYLSQSKKIIKQC